MRTLISLLLLLLAWSANTAAQGSLLSAIDQLPPCALECLSTAITASPCGLTNQTCICTNQQLQSSVETCVLKSCTVKQGLTTKNITMTTCGAPIRNKTGIYRTISITLGVISAVCVLLRLFYKLVLTMGELGLDDCFIGITLIDGVPSTIINVRGMAANGLGKDIWTLSFPTITNFVRWFYILEVLYFSQVSLLKLSLLFFYLRIFPGKPVRRLIWATIIFNTLYGVAFVLTAIFQCRPISFYWNSWDAEHSGHCININALGWANATISIVLDIWMLAIPMSQLIHLKLAWKKKVGVAMMFCVGTFVTIVSILRLQSLVHFANSSNPTWDQWDINNWSTVEINVGVICACMPAIRVILVRLFPKALGSTRNATNQYYAKYGSHSRAVGHGTSTASQPGVITYTKTFEVQHGDHDETRLVQMDDLSPTPKEPRSNSSEVSLYERSQI
ncbi:uncharacterized protein BDR25DRAFT_91906 [Lindgomyces ingoldianus]|uniref:Uncharacterized protein n=1 Tax=Lindgomyces ingoldianus TaxID=673940 RepID=A0ACB6QFS9_9PLEO|nr:uncharacterized protein BDR25DRAFT_91906 [Lindgomyces ingoldianus]KAF2464991.1 hypothetical protein BDR25DRAFT_91906 [Lindgomyces ingoldianus]